MNLPRQPDAAAIERLADAAIRALPAPFSDYLSDVVLRIEEFADAETLEALGIDDAWDLSGLYHGRPVGERSAWDTGELPSTITLYRAPLVDEWLETGVELADLITHVIVHEVGHHFGLSDEDMAAIEREEE